MGVIETKLCSKSYQIVNLLIVLSVIFLVSTLTVGCNVEDQKKVSTSVLKDDKQTAKSEQKVTKEKKADLETNTEKPTTTPTKETSKENRASSVSRSIQGGGSGGSSSANIIPSTTPSTPKINAPLPLSEDSSSNLILDDFEDNDIFKAYNQPAGHVNWGPGSGSYPDTYVNLYESSSVVHSGLYSMKIVRTGGAFPNMWLRDWQYGGITTNQLLSHTYFTMWVYDNSSTASEFILQHNSNSALDRRAYTTGNGWSRLSFNFSSSYIFNNNEVHIVPGGSGTSKTFYADDVILANCTCSSGTCCDGCEFKNSNTVCKSKISTEYGCPWGNQLGNDNAVRYLNKYCSGSSSDCEGSVSWTDWALNDDCTSAEKCLVNYPTCINPAYSCYTDQQCGISTWLNQSFCQNGDVYQPQLLFTCNSPGSSASSCSNSTGPRLKERCLHGCSNGSCVISDQAPYLYSDQYSLLDGIFRMHMNYFLSNQIITKYGLPSTAYKINDRARFGYSNPTEWGYTMQAWIAASERGIITKADAKSRINKSLQTMNTLQNTPGQIYQGLFYPYYKVINATGSDVFPYMDGDTRIPSIDNGFLYTSLLIVEGWSYQNNFSDIANLSKTIKNKMNYSIFLFENNTKVSHQYNTTTGKLNTDAYWANYPDEAGMMTVIMYLSNAVDFNGFIRLTNSQRREERVWQGNRVKEAALFNAMFAWSVRSLSGFEIEHTPYSKESMVPTTKAHLDYGDYLNINYPAFSDAMSQAHLGNTIKGEYYPPNLDNNVPIIPPKFVEPHALFVPFNVIGDLNQSLIARLIDKINMMMSDSNNYYRKSSPYQFGFTAIASPLANDTNYKGADDGKDVFETLGNAYIALSLYNGLQKNNNSKVFADFASNVPGYIEKSNQAINFLYPGYKNCIDNDNDGFNSSQSFGSCGIADCNDNNASLWQNKTVFVDMDKDGYGTGSQLQICSGLVIPAGFASSSDDCNDNNISIHPNATEICNGIDDNCNNQTDEGNVCLSTIYYCDKDNDKYYSSTISGNCSTFNCLPINCTKIQGNDCNDNNVNIHPNATELCNSIDDDCSALTLDGINESWYNTSSTCGIGECQRTGQLLCINGKQNNTCIPGPPTVETCNGLDDNCDNTIDNGGDALCVDNLYCDGVDTCQGTLGCKEGTPIDCSAENRPSIATCTNDPDNNPFTWDYFRGFNSTCIETLKQCNTTETPITHICNKSNCNAQCEINNDCNDNNPLTVDTCLSNCSCSHLPTKSCINLTSNLVISANITVCKKSYQITNITIIGNNIVIDCNSSTFTGSNELFSIKNSSNVILKNCAADRYIRVGFSAFNSRNITFDNLYCTKNNYCVEIYSSKNVTVKNIITYDIFDSAIYLYKSDGTVVVGNNLTYSEYGPGIYVDSSNNTKILRNDISRNGGSGSWYYKSGIAIQSSYGTYLSNNFIHNNYAYGIYSSMSYNTTIIYNEISSNYGNGIRANYNYTIQYNNISSNLLNGIKSDSESNVIRFNNILGNNKSDFSHESMNKINISLNFWNTTNCSEIDNRIFDYKDSIYYGNATYEPFLDNAYPLGKPAYCPLICTDIDKDGYNITGGLCGPIDCNDNNLSIHPNTTELCNGIDDNCNNQIDEGNICPIITYYCDKDNDKYYSSTISGNCSTYNCMPQNCTKIQGNDCNDNNVNIHPNATELCNGIDDDCSTLTSDGINESWYNTTSTCGIGECQKTGQLLCLNGKQNSTCIPGLPTTEICNGLDDNCDNTIDNGGNALCVDNLYCDGAETCQGSLGCKEGIPIDCSANNISSIATCLNNPDNNPFTWDYFKGFTSICMENIDSCSSSTLSINHTCDKSKCSAQCANNADCNDGIQSTIDICLGNCSCTHTLNCTDSDKDGFNATGGLCGPVDCNDNNVNIHPNAFEICNGLDDDCSALTLDGINEPWYNTTSTCGIGECQRTGKWLCINSKKNNSCSPGLPTTEICNGLDDNCDNTIDNGGNALCSDNLYCNGAEVCQGSLGCKIGTPIDCSINNLPSIATCTNNPDNNPFTWDYFRGFTSTCIENVDSCNSTTLLINHTCDKSKCNAECASSADCIDEDSNTVDICKSNCACSNLLSCTDSDKDGFNTTGGSCGIIDCNDNNKNVYPNAVEVCNGIDDNCDNIVDPGCDCINGETKSCGSNIGECRFGTSTCNSGHWGTCIGGVNPVPETCDGKDNNCDNVIDEGCSQLPDLIITNLKRFRPVASPNASDNVIYQFNIENIGNSTAFSVNWMLNMTQLVKYPNNLIDIKPKEIVPVYIGGIFGKSGTFDITAYVDYDKKIRESNEDNNKQKIIETVN